MYLGNTVDQVHNQANSTSSQKKIPDQHNDTDIQGSLKYSFIFPSSSIIIKIPVKAIMGG